MGGDDRARGYPTNFFVGQNAYAYNLEFRTRPVEILSAEVGTVLFYDVADAANGPLSALRPYQSAGGGIRVLFPWLDRVVFRADLGVPFQRPPAVGTSGPAIAPVNFVITFAQAFDTPNIAPGPRAPSPSAVQSSRRDRRPTLSEGRRLSADRLRDPAVGVVTVREYGSFPRRRARSVSAEIHRPSVKRGSAGEARPPG